jgi:hypothetical protein
MRDREFRYSHDTQSHMVVDATFAFQFSSVEEKERESGY